MLIKPPNTRDKEEILKTVREIRQITYKRRIIKLLTGFSKATRKDREEQHNVFSA